MKRPKIFFFLLSHANLQYLSFDLLGSGVSTIAWLRCTVGISLDWFCDVYKLSSHPAKHVKNSLFKIPYEPRHEISNNAVCATLPRFSPDQSQQHVIPDLDLNGLALTDS